VKTLSKNGVFNKDLHATTMKAKENRWQTLIKYRQSSLRFKMYERQKNQLGTNYYLKYTSENDRVQKN